MGTAYRNIGLPDQALVQYRTALKYEPGHLNARYNMGMVYAFDLRNYHAAIQYLGRAAAARPELSPCRLYADLHRELQKSARKAP